MSAAATRPAISAAIDDTDLPNFSSQRSVSVRSHRLDVIRRKLDFLIRGDVSQTRHPGENYREGILSNCAQHP